MTPTRKSVSRDDLYAQVWSQPISQLASTLGVTGTYIARICRELNVPTPTRGYWAQVKAGKTPPKAALPTLRPGEPTIWVRETISALRTNRVPQAPAGYIGIPNRRRNVPPHGLLLSAKEVFNNSNPSYASIHLSPRQRKLVDLLTTKEHLEKTISIAQRLFSRLEDYGYPVKLAIYEDSFHKTDVSDELVIRDRSKDLYRVYPWRPSCCTVAYLGTVAIGLTVVEMAEEIQQTGWYSSRKVGSGQYRLYAYSPYLHTSLVCTWQDSKEESLISTLDPIIRRMEEMANEIPGLIQEGERLSRLAHEQWEAQQREYQRKRAIEVRQENEKESLESLKKVIRIWAEYRNQQQFFEELAKAVKESPDQRAELQRRIEIARQLLQGTSAIDLLLAWKLPDELAQS